MHQLSENTYLEIFYMLYLKQKSPMADLLIQTEGITEC